MLKEMIPSVCGFNVQKELSKYGVWLIEYKDERYDNVNQAVIRETNPGIEEIINVTSLLSENIVQIYRSINCGPYQSDGRSVIIKSYLIEEYCDQGDLIKYSMNFNEEMLKKFMFMLIKTLKAMHRHGVAHRDISPDNIFVVGNVPKFGDLNDCKMYIANLSTANTIQNTRKGKINYQSPLQMLYKETWNSISNPFADDIWSLGKVFYECAQREFGQTFFNTNGLIIEQGEIEGRINSNLRNFTDQFREIIIGMMKYEENERLTARKAYKMIRSIYYPSS